MNHQAISVPTRVCDNIPSTANIYRKINMNNFNLNTSCWKHGEQKAVLTIKN